MSSFPHADYPWGPLRDALTTTIGRIALLMVAMFFGISIGAAIAHKSFFGLILGLLESPWILFTSIIFGVGVIVFPFSLLFGFLFTRYEWPLWTTSMILFAFTYLSYDATDFALHRSAGSKIDSILNEALEKK